MVADTLHHFKAAVKAEFGKVVVKNTAYAARFVAVL